MKRPLKKLFLGAVYFSNICCLLALLCSNIAPWVNPVTYWPVALTGMLFPLLFAATCLYIFFWLFVKKRNAIISVVVLLTSIPNFIATFGVNVNNGFQQAKQPRAIRILTWNVELMGYMQADSNVAIKNNAVIFKKLRESDADIICLQEFFTSVIPGNHYNLMDSISRTLHYPYYYLARDIEKFEGSFYDGSIIFSRYKIVDSQRILYPAAYSGSVIRTGIALGQDTIDIVTTRLQSVKFIKNDYRELSEIKRGSKDAIAGSRGIITKLRGGYQNRLRQIDTVTKVLASSHRALILTGDMNDVPVSYTYRKVKMNMKNAWENKGFGLGKTFRYISPTLRIDQIFFNDLFKATQVRRIISGDESDHHGIICDLLPIKKEQ